MTRQNKSLWIWHCDCMDKIRNNIIVSTEKKEMHALLQMVDTRPIYVDYIE